MKANCKPAGCRVFPSSLAMKPTNTTVNDSAWESEGLGRSWHVVLGGNRTESLKYKEVHIPSTPDGKTPNGSLPLKSRDDHLSQVHKSATGAPTLTPYSKRDSKVNCIHQTFSIQSKQLCGPITRRCSFPQLPAYFGATTSSPLTPAFHRFFKLYIPIPQAAGSQNSKKSPLLCILSVSPVLSS